MGFFDDPFDLNNDGRRSLDEDYLEFMMFNEFMNKHDEQDDDWDSSFDEFSDEEDDDLYSDDDVSSYGVVTEYYYHDTNTYEQEKKQRAEQFRNKIPAAADPEILANFDNQLARFTETKKKQKRGTSFRILVAVLIMVALIIILIVILSIIR